MISKKYLAISIVLLFAYLFIFQLHAIWPYTVDDMYIPLRYAKNWINNGHLLWNLDRESVEGYSNFSFVVMGALSLKLGGDPVLTLKTMGIIGLLLTVIGLFKLTRFWFSSALSCIPCIWLLQYRGQIIWASSGLETTLYEAALVLAVFFLIRGLGYRSFPCVPLNTYRSKDLYISGFFLLIASLTRPEGILLAGLFFSIAFFSAPKNIETKKPLLKLVGLFTLCYLPYFLWRLWYYRRFLPNPIYCKGYDSHFFMQVDLSYLLLVYPFLILALLAFYKSEDKRYYFLGLPSVLYLCLLAFADTVSIFDNRLFLPAYVLLLPLGLIGIQRMGQWVLKNHTHAWITSMTALLIGAYYIPMLSLNGYREFVKNTLNGEEMRYQLVSWLQQNIPTNQSVVLGDAGLVPYHASHPFIDSYCLNNKEMTKIIRIKKKNRYESFCEAVLRRREPVIILMSLHTKNKTVYAPTDACLSQKLKHNPHYVYQKRFEVAHVDTIYRYDIYTVLND